ncbi:hypothetical protein HUT17_05215 (plasmid) [Nocardiopsis flavescens]|nr:hypothetical protein HUT17_05215 [Nocardiopsis flavescens]
MTALYDDDVPSGRILPDAVGHDLRPDPMTATTPAEFMELLRRYRIWSGQMSYREMALRSGRTVAASTFCTALRRDQLPKQSLLRTIIEVCGGTLAEQQTWVTAWRRLALQ